VSNYFLPIVCVVIIAIGQIFFKLDALELQKTGNFFNFKVVLFFLIAIILYGLSSLLWVIALQKFSLSKIYPIMALAFILVPLASFFIFHEKLSLQYFCGLFLIISGIFLIANS
jgi:drug/metabolite transporter (DMT)-like permease